MLWRVRSRLRDSRAHVRPVPVFQHEHRRSVAQRSSSPRRGAAGGKAGKGGVASAAGLGDFCRGGAGGASLGEAFERNGVFFLPFLGEMFWFRLTLNVFHLGLRLGRWEDGRRLFPERGREVGQLKGELCSIRFYLFIFSPWPKRKRSFCVRAHNVFQVWFEFAQRYRARRDVLSMVSLLRAKCRSLLCCGRSSRCVIPGRNLSRALPRAPRLSRAVGSRTRSLKEAKFASWL